MRAQNVPITGMTCGSCVEKVRSRLTEHSEIESAIVTLQPPQAVLQATRPLAAEEIDAWLTPTGRYRVSPAEVPAAPDLPAKNVTTYKPLLILAGYLVAVTACGLVATGRWDGALAMRLFMGGFFIAFSFFKLLDLRGFADAYRSYDIVAKAWPGYGLIYPFIELGLGLAYIANADPFLVNLVTAGVMTVSLVGVLRAVLSKTAIRCACLGTVFQLPMSTVTIIEDGLMLTMALAMILMNR